MPLFTTDQLRRSAQQLKKRITDLLASIDFSDEERTGDDLELVADLLIGFPPDYATQNRKIIHSWKKDPQQAKKLLKDLRQQLLDFNEKTAASRLSPRFIDSIIEQLRKIDIGYNPRYARGQLEMLGDVMIAFPEEIVKQFDMAIRYCGSNPQRAQEYLVGPSDYGSGNGIINDLIALRNERLAIFKLGSYYYRLA
jgi:hypothetical protein